ncbi:MAG TPA: tetratricopeptide repeat protein [Rubrivivax sp.]
MKTLPSFLVALALTAAALSSPALAQNLRPEVGKPLQQAGELLRAGKAREALAKVREADAASGKTPAEQLTIDRMKGAAAQRAGDNATAIAAFESLMASGKLPAGEQVQIAESLAFAYSQQKDTAKANQWIQRAQSLGSTSPQLKQLQAYMQSQSGDYAAIARDSAAAVSAAEGAGRKPDEGDLLRLADAQQRTGNMSGYGNTLEKLLAHYPKKDYWNAYLGRLPRKAGFADRFALDVMRLRLASGTLTKTEDFMEMAQLALQAGLPAEGRRIAEQGFKSGALGTGPEAARHQRLKDLAVKQEAESKGALLAQSATAATRKDGNDLVKVGYALVSQGDTDAGIQLIEAGIAKGGLKYPEDAKLRLGMAMLQSGKNRAKALQTLRGVGGTDGAAEIARLWTVVNV